MPLEAANAQTGIETDRKREVGTRLFELEAANAQTGIETLAEFVREAVLNAVIRSSECSNGH